MDSHNVGRGRKSIVATLAEIKAKTLIIGIENDILFPISEQHFLAAHIPLAEFNSINCAYGHDGFLIETEKLTDIIGNFLKGDSIKKIFKLNKTA